MNIQGSYKFKTLAVNDFFISLYIKVEFFVGGQQVTHDEYAQVLSEGKVTDFWWLKRNPYELVGFHNRYPFRGNYSIDLSPNVVVTLIAVDDKGKIVYEREFPDYHQYSIHQPSRLAVWDLVKIHDEWDEYVSLSIPGFPNYPGFIFALPELSAFIDLDAEGNWIVTGIISPNSFMNFGVNSNNSAFGLPTSYDWYDWGFYRSVGHSFGGLYYPILSFKDYEPLVEIGEISYIKNYTVTGSTLMAHSINYVGGGLWGCSWYYPYGHSTGFYNPLPGYYPGVIIGETGPTGVNPSYAVHNPSVMFPSYCFEGGDSATYPEYPTGGYVSANFSSTFAHIYPNTQSSPPAGFPYFMLAADERHSLNSSYYLDIDNVKNITYDLYPVAIVHPNNEGSYRKYTFSTPLDDPIIKDSKNGSMLKYRSYAWDFDIQSALLTIDETEIPFNYSPWDSGRHRSKSLPGWFYHRRAAFFMYEGNIYTANITYNNTQNKNEITIEKNFKIPNHLRSDEESPTVLTPYLIDRDISILEKEKTDLYEPFMDALLENYPDGNFPIPFFEIRTSSLTGYLEYSNQILSGTNCYSPSTKTFWKYCNSVFNPYGVQ